MNQVETGSFGGDIVVIRSVVACLDYYCTCFQDVSSLIIPHVLIVVGIIETVWLQKSCQFRNSVYTAVLILEDVGTRVRTPWTITTVSIVKIQWAEQWCDVLSRVMTCCRMVSRGVTWCDVLSRVVTCFHVVWCDVVSLITMVGNLHLTAGSNV